jgi:hypothetical protein
MHWLAIYLERCDPFERRQLPKLNCSFLLMEFDSLARTNKRTVREKKWLRRETERALM